MYSRLSQGLSLCLVSVLQQCDCFSHCFMHFRLREHECANGRCDSCTAASDRAARGVVALPSDRWPGHAETAIFLVYSVPAQHQNILFSFVIDFLALLLVCRALAHTDRAQSQSAYRIQLFHNGDRCMPLLVAPDR